MSKIIRKNIIKTLSLILLFSLALTAMAEIYGIEDVTEDVKTENTQHLGGDMVWEDWEVRLTAISSAGGMDWAKLGSAENATTGFDIPWDEPEPPTPPFSPIIQAYFYYQGCPVSTLNVSYIKTSISMTWRLILYVDIHDVSNTTNITLEWNDADIENVPEEYYLTLHTSNESINMREEYNYTFSATTGYYDFDITAMIDVTLPEISNVSVYPDPQIVGGYVNISADVIDIELDEVFLYLLYPDMTEENFSITQNKTGDTYYCNRTYNQLGVYTFHIWANDSSGFSNVSANYTFEMTNQPPYNPSNPNPEDGATGVNISTNLSWTGGDPDGHPVTYDVYFGNMSPPVQVAWNQSETTYDPGTMNNGTMYYWQIVAWDNHGASSSGPIWNFTTETEVNNPPNTPSNPNPGNGATGVDYYAVLSWTGGDPDPGDTVTYDVYLGTTSPPPQVSSNQSSTTYDPLVLQPVTTYFWKIVAYDNHGASTSGPIWSFTTKSLPADYMMVESSICVPGETGKTIYINGRWSEEIQAYTFALFFDPEKIEIDHGSFVGTVGQTADIQICETAEPGVLTVGALWLVGGYPPAGSGPLLKLVVNISSNAIPGERILLHLDDYEPSFICLYMNTEFPPMPIYPELVDGILTITDVTCGDCNNDGIINLGDVVKLINYLYRGGDPPIPYACVGDVTCDGVVNLGDVVKLINYLYRGGDPPCEECCPFPGYSDSFEGTNVDTSYWTLNNADKVYTSTDMAPVPDGNKSLKLWCDAGYMGQISRDFDGDNTGTIKIWYWVPKGETRLEILSINGDFYDNYVVYWSDASSTHWVYREGGTLYISSVPLPATARWVQYKMTADGNSTKIWVDNQDGNGFQLINEWEDIDYITRFRLGHTWCDQSAQYWDLYENDFELVW